MLQANTSLDNIGEANITFVGDTTMSNQIFVLDTNLKPLTPCKPSMARKLLNANKAAVFRQFPFTIILKKEVVANPEPIEIKIDAGSKTTGLALVQDEKVIFGAELSHRGQAIKNSLESRRSLRRNRRNRKTRYRQARFAVRSTGSFNVSASTLIQGISHKYCKTIHHKDGYSYGF